MKITADRKEAIKAINALNDESSKEDVLAVFSQARKVFARIKTFAQVESSAWDMALAGGCWRRVHGKMSEFAAQIDAPQAGHSLPRRQHHQKIIDDVMGEDFKA